MSSLSAIFLSWRESLSHILQWFSALQANTKFFFTKLFAFFVVLNLGSYWWSLATAYPKKLGSEKLPELLIMQFPVGILGGVFDFLSLFVTIYIAKRAINTTNNFGYVGYLSVDLVIAGLATLWVLLVFTVSGWVVNIILSISETLGDRTDLYQGRFRDAIYDPFDPENLKNIYFGIVMGASAMVPTIIHLFLAIRSLMRMLVSRIKI